MTTNLIEDLNWKINEENHKQIEKEDLIKQIKDATSKWHTNINNYEITLKYDEDNSLVLHPNIYRSPYNYHDSDSLWYVELKNKNGTYVNSICNSLSLAKDIYTEQLNILKTGKRTCNFCSGKGTHTRTDIKKRFLQKPLIKEEISTCEHCNGTGKIDVKL